MLTSVEECDVAEGIHAIALCVLAQAVVPCCFDRDTLENDCADTCKSKNYEEGCG